MDKETIKFTKEVYLIINILIYSMILTFLYFIIKEVLK